MFGVALVLKLQHATFMTPLNFSFRGGHIQGQGMKQPI